MPQLVVIVQVLVAQRQPIDTLRHQLLDRVLDPHRIAMVTKTGGKLRDDPGALLHLAQQQTARIAGDYAPVKPTPHFALSEGMKS